MIDKLAKWVKSDEDAWSYHTDSMDKIRDALPAIIKVLKVVDSFADNGEEIDKAMARLKRILESIGDGK